MIDEFIENFRQKHGFNRHTAMLPYVDEDDSDNEPIKLEGGRKMVIWKCIISLTRLQHWRRIQTTSTT